MKNKLLLVFSLLFLVGCSPNEEVLEESGGTSVENVTVSYCLSNEVVHTLTIEKGSTLGVDYIYDYASHQTHVPTWKDEKGNEYNKDSIMDKDLTLQGSPKTNLNIFNNTEDDFVSIVGINHVHSDGVLVLSQTYYSKNIVIAENAITNSNDVREIYLPRVINHIYSGNFQGCNNLTKIYYEGTMEQFDAILKDAFPTSVHMVFNTAFSF